MAGLGVTPHLFLAGHWWLVAAFLGAACVAAGFPLAGLEMVLLVLLPIAVGLLWTLRVMEALGISVNITNSVPMIPIVGVAVGYGLFLLMAELAHFRGRPERPSTTSGSIIMGGITAGLGFGSLALSRHPVLYSLGMTAFLAMGFSMVATVLLIPSGARMFLRRSACGGAPRLYHLMGGLWCLIYLLVIHFILLTIALPIATLIHPRSRALRARGLRRLARPGLAGLVHTFPYGRVVCSDVTRSAFTRPSVIISNHQSIVDIPLLSRIPCDLRLTIKSQWWTHPLIGAGVKALGHIRVEPGDPDAVMRQCSQAFAEGSSIHFFPQGTRSRSDAPLRFHKGAFELAIHSNAEIQPLVLCDTWTCLPRGGIWVENFCMRMKVLPRITPATFDYSLGAKALAKHAEERMYGVWIEELEQNNTPAILRRKVERLYRYQGLRAEMRVFARLRGDPGLLELHGLLPRKGLVLDLGCGYGPISHWLAQASPERKVLGVDRNPDKIRVAQCSALGSQQVVFETHDFREWPLPECSAVVLLDVMGEFTAQEDDAVLGRAFEALVQGGRLIMRVAVSCHGTMGMALTREYAVKLRNFGFTTTTASGTLRGGRALLVACKT